MGKTTVRKNSNGTSTVWEGGKFAGKLPSDTAKKAIPTASDPKIAPSSNQPAPPPANYSDIHARFSDLSSSHAWVLQQPLGKQREIVNDPDVSSQLLRAIATDSRTQVEVLVEIAKGSKADAETVAFLSRHPNTVVRCWSAWSEKLPAAELPRLAKDRDVNVRHGVPEHKEAPAELMFIMGSRTTETDRYIRQRARDHKNYPKKSERLAMVEDRRVTPQALQILAGDGVPQVAAAARRKLESLGLEVPVFDEED